MVGTANCSEPRRPSTVCRVLVTGCILLAGVYGCGNATQLPPSAPDQSARGAKCPSCKAAALACGCMTGRLYHVGREPRADAVLAAVRESYANKNNFRAQFTHRWRRDESRHGVVIYARPNKYDFRYDNGDRVVSDGIRLISYDAARNLAQARPAQCAPETMVFLFMHGFSPNFYGTWLSSNELAYRDGEIVAVAPRANSQVFEMLHLYVDRTTSQIASVRLLSRERNFAVFAFSDWEFDLPVAGTEFAFDPPKGVTWLE